MCGFVGYLSLPNNKNQGTSLETIRKMSDALVHRGPDSYGFWHSHVDGITLGFRRLAIQDTSEKGNQPMISASGQYVIVFNGEIYNHFKLRKQVENIQSNYPWKSNSDTETLLACFDLWGIDDTIRKCLGMFSFAVWCNKNKLLTLGRDRLGEKPLYYGWQGNDENATFFFGSELKAFHQHPVFKKQINRNAISSFLRHSYIPAPHSIYKDIFKLLPAHFARISFKNKTPLLTRYWSPKENSKKIQESEIYSNDCEAIDCLERMLNGAVKEQMISDVPIGAFLSGGIDSSTIVSMMQLNSTQRIRTFTVGFKEKDFNEADHARAVAEHLKTDHSDIYIDSQDLINVIPSLANIYDEPFGDSSQIPTYLISKFAKQDVTVALSGDGGDELFCGYNRYKITDQYWKKLQKIPLPIRKLISSGILKVKPSNIEKFYSFFNSNKSYSNLSDKLYKGSQVLESSNISDLYTNLVSSYKNPDSIVIHGNESNTFFDSSLSSFLHLDDISLMMSMDLLTYLPDDILVKVDRASMGVSLETRAPMLNHKLVEFAYNLPKKYKLRSNTSKWLLREVLYRNVPRHLIERPKVGFAVPIGEWLRTSLKEWASDLLSEETLKKQGFFDYAKIYQCWQQHQSSKYNWEHFLWNVLIFQSWYKEFHEKG